MALLLGVDLGGTKVEAAVIDSDTMMVIARHRIATEAHLGYDHILGRIASVITKVEEMSQTRFEKVGIATPGTLEPSSQTMKNCNTTALNGRMLKADLENLIQKTVTLSNDANCFAIAEAKMGAAFKINPTANVVLGLIMGTGTGSGIVVNGKILSGLHGIGGEWGHNFLDDSGGACYCGRSGCVEMVISGPALETYYFNKAGVNKKMNDIVDSYRLENDVVAIATMERLFVNFGKAVAVLINVIDPDVIVIGGGLGNIDELYSIGKSEVAKHVFNHELITVFTKPLLGDSAGVFGAALL